MAEFKTAEQYVVARCEELERKLEETEAKYKKEILELAKNYDKVKAELCDAYDLLNMFRDNIRVRSTCYGRAICVDNIYETDNFETIEALSEYFDLRVEEDDDA
jgi:hypothetical protein